MIFQPTRILLGAIALTLAPMSLASGQIGAATQTSGRAARPARPVQPNIVIVVADDFGVDLVNGYGEGADLPCTPNIDAMMAEGLTFRNFWARPACSPTRAALVTGRHGFRTGIGGLVMNNRPGLGLGEITLPEALPGYENAWIGKWHLSGSLGATHPNDSGFDYFAGNLRGAVQDYYDWNQIRNGVTVPKTEYLTIVETDEAVAALNTFTGPFAMVLAFHAPHSPYQEPPMSLCSGQGCPAPWCATLPQMPSQRELGKAMVEAMDQELGRFLGELDALHPNSYVFFVGDNGTARQLTVAPFNRMRAKGSMYEGGIRVPMVVRGPGVAQGEETQSIAGITDLLATVAELAGQRVVAEDSVSLTRCMSDPTVAPREYVYSEIFSPNHVDPSTVFHQRAVRDARYKLIRRTGMADELFDLTVDRFETNNLLPNLTPAEQQAYNGLIAELGRLGVS